MQPLASDQPEPPPSSAERDVTASGVRLRVLDGGAGPPVVLIHGLFMDNRTWTSVRVELCRRFRVIAPDLPGFGQSEKPPPQRFPYGIDAFVDSIADLYAGLEIGRAALVGHDIGAAVALTLAARHPELVSHLVLVSPWLHPEGAAPESQIARLPLLGNLVFKQLVGRGLFRSYFHERLSWQRDARASERIDAFYEAFNTPAARGSALATLCATADTRAVLAQTARIQTPTLVVGGHADRLFPPRVGQRLAREIRGAGFELLDAGHAPQEEHPRELAALITRFLQPRSRPNSR
jgi:pimeloyl-ACP methyl ester carboxylesterase